jgi:hypothetical protein
MRHPNASTAWHHADLLTGGVNWRCGSACGGELR